MRGRQGKAGRTGARVGGTRIGRALAALALGACGGVHAASCGSPSPEPFGDHERPRDTSAPAARGAPSTPPFAGRDGVGRVDARRLIALRERLHGATFAGGEGRRTRCLGDDGREIGWRFDLEQLERVPGPRGRTLLTAFESRHTVLAGRRDERRVDGTLVAEVIDLPPPGHWTASADLSALRAYRRFRRAGASSESCALARRPLPPEPVLPSGVPATACTYLTEIDTTARAVGRVVEIEQRHYVGGRLSERVLWRLES